MIRKSNVLVLFILFVLGCGGLYAQVVPNDPQTNKPVFEVFTIGNSGYFGVETQEITKENFGKFGLRDVRGVVVQKVLKDSPAEKAGLQEGDVIIRFNSEEVSSSQKLDRLISETAPDHQAKITILRNGNEQEVMVTIGNNPKLMGESANFKMATPIVSNLEIATPMVMNFTPAFPLFSEFQVAKLSEGVTDLFVLENGKNGKLIFGLAKQIGVSLSPLTKQLSDYFGVADGKGILINDVAENSPAAKAGLKAGDVIIEVEGKSISNKMELINGINEKQEGGVTLTILRNRNRQSVKVTPEKLKESDVPFTVFKQSGK